MLLSDTFCHFGAGSQDKELLARGTSCQLVCTECCRAQQFRSAASATTPMARGLSGSRGLAGH
eukprot:2477162-Amphidinium_carterae.1